MNIFSLLFECIKADCILMSRWWQDFLHGWESECWQFICIIHILAHILFCIAKAIIELWKDPININANKTKNVANLLSKFVINKLLI